MHGDGVEAIIDRDISRQRVKNTLLRLDRKTRAPAVHGLRPLDRMDADIGAAVDGYHAVAMHKSPQFQQLQSQRDFFRIEGREFKNLKSDAGFADLEIEAIENHRAVIGRERKPVCDHLHAWRVSNREGAQQMSARSNQARCIIIPFSSCVVRRSDLALHQAPDALGRGRHFDMFDAEFR